jgi:hypothetical protein
VAKQPSAMSFNAIHNADAQRLALVFMKQYFQKPIDRHTPKIVGSHW